MSPTMTWKQSPRYIRLQTTLSASRTGFAQTKPQHVADHYTILTGFDSGFRQISGGPSLISEEHAQLFRMYPLALITAFGVLCLTLPSSWLVSLKRFLHLIAL